MRRELIERVLAVRMLALLCELEELRRLVELDVSLQAQSVEVACINAGLQSISDAHVVMVHGKVAEWSARFKPVGSPFSALQALKNYRLARREAFGEAKATGMRFDQIEGRLQRVAEEWMSEL